MRPGAFAALVLLATASCKDHSDDYDYLGGERRGVICATTTVKYLGKGQSTNPIDARERQDVVLERQCWMQTIDQFDGGTSTGSLVRLDGQPGEAAHGCAFTGTGPNYQVNLDTGFCAANTDAGYYRFKLDSPAALTPDLNSIELDGVVEWSRGDDLLSGPAFIFLSVPQLDPVMTKPAYDKRIPVDVPKTCKMAECVRASLGGTGTLLKGDPLICNDLLSGRTDPLSLYFDDQDRMSFTPSTEEAQRRRGVHGFDRCTLDTWTGSRPYPYTRYHLDAEGSTLTVEEVTLHQANNLSDVCTVRWSATISGC